MIIDECKPPAFSITASTSTPTVSSKHRRTGETDVHSFSLSPSIVPDSSSQLLAAVRKQYPEYPNAFYQLNNQQQAPAQQQQQINPMYYPGAQSSAAAYPGMYPYSRAGSPTMNQVYPHSHVNRKIVLDG